MRDTLPEVPGTPCIGLSALTGAGVEQVLPTALQAFRVWNQRVPTARLNRWLIKARPRSLPNPTLSLVPILLSLRKRSG